MGYFETRRRVKYWPACLLVGLVPSIVRASLPDKPAYRLIDADGIADFRRDVQPLLKKYCYDCHADGAKSGNVAFDGLENSPTLLSDHKLFGKVLKNLRSSNMPPKDEPQPSAAEKEIIARWIKGRVFQIDPKNLDPGRVTMRRLNRAEYRNTIRDLMGVDFDTLAEFPPDDAGHGFDNIGDVLTVSPMLLEKYLDAAQVIVAQAVPSSSKVVAETAVFGSSFKSEGAQDKADKADKGGVRLLSYSEAATVSHTLQIEHPGKYQLVFDLMAHENYVDNKFDYNKCRLIIRADDKELFRQEYNREGNKPLRYLFDVKWDAGPHRISFELQPLTPGVEQIRSLAIQINKLTLRGPFEAKYGVEPANYRTYFPKPVPAGLAERRVYARGILAYFASRAFRRPVDKNTLTRLVSIAEGVYTQPGQTFEAGVSQAMIATLASSRFLFRQEEIAPQQKQPFALVDEYALASRLSYFLWSSMPDEELFRLARQGQLRKNLRAQVTRMLGDKRSEALTSNFSGQWLQTRDIERVPLNARAVLAREIDPATVDPAAPVGGRGRRPSFDLDENLRKALHRETDLYFDYIVHQDRSVLELINSNYTFVNAPLAKYYGISDPSISGAEFRRVTLPEGSPRGGVLTMGSVLAVTSNPTRTSPVKRGLFILDNILGAPAPPPPPDIPPLEDAAAKLTGHTPTSREVLAAHRDKPECASCHSRMDPPGLALESFNALGQWREKEFGQPIQTDGTLITGESFKDIRGLKQILATRHSGDFYRCLTEKMLTYALGRGLEDVDVGAVDQIVDGLQSDNGKFSTLLLGVIESAPFQKCRNLSMVATPISAKKRAKTGAAKPSQPAKPLNVGKAATQIAKNRSHAKL